MKYKSLIPLFVFIFNCSLFKFNDNYCTEEPGDVWSCRRYFGVTMSPDENWIAFIYAGNPHDSVSKTDTIGIYLFNIQSSEFIALLTGYMLDMSVPHHLDFSPDGEWIVFSWQKQIWKIKINGDSLTQLTFSGENFYPRWSPDGKKISFHKITPVDLSGIWIMKANGKGKKRILSGYEASWMPGGKYLIYSGPGGDVYKGDTLGSSIIKILDMESIGAIDRIYFPICSHDGSKILFVARRQGEGPMVWIMDSDGSDPVPLARGWEANWSSDGKKILYTQTENCDIWIMNANGCNKIPFIGDFNFLKGGEQ